ncbi:MAG: hypothetical protein EA374_04815 [Acholeplasmatales bacterium]|nr:MAG: hypothetical protein EA374_04815 [Acholeplasmatales bacterium]
MKANQKPDPIRHDFTVSFYGLYFGLLGLFFMRVFILRQDVVALWDFGVLFVIISVGTLIRMRRAGTWPTIWDEHGKLLFGKHLIDTLLSTFFFAFIMVIAGFWSLDTPGGVFGALIGASVYAVLWWFLPVLLKRQPPR